jgi:hypothetical protein
MSCFCQVVSKLIYFTIIVKKGTWLNFASQITGNFDEAEDEAEASDII